MKSFCDCICNSPYIYHSKNRNAVVTKSVLFQLNVVQKDACKLVTNVVYNNLKIYWSPWE